MGISIKRMAVDDFAADSFVPLFDAYQAETGLDGFGNWRISFDAYRLLERAGMIVLFAAFDGEKPVGMVGGVVGKHSHYDEPTMTTDGLFVLPEYRTRGVGARLIAMVIREARSRGIRVLCVSCTPNSDLDSELSKSASFALSTKTYMRRI